MVGNIIFTIRGMKAYCIVFVLFIFVIPLCLYFAGAQNLIFRMVLPLYYVVIVGLLLCTLTRVFCYFSWIETFFIAIAVGVSFFVIWSSITTALPTAWSSSALFVYAEALLIFLGALCFYKSKNDNGRISIVLKSHSTYYWLLGLFSHFL